MIPYDEFIQLLIVPAFLKKLICRVLGLLVPFLDLNRFGILLGELEEGQVASSGWPFVSIVPGQMTHLVASLTLDSARSCMMQGAFLTQGKAASLYIRFFVGAAALCLTVSCLILLLLVTIVAVGIGVAVIWVVVVGEVFIHLLKFEAVKPRWYKTANSGSSNEKAFFSQSNSSKFHLQSSVQLLRRNTDSVRSNQWMRPTSPSVPLKLKVFAMVAACASRAVETLSATSFLMRMPGAVKWDGFFR
ncbi:hypothetical protein Tco_0085894 [Tanacetum coccineum]